MVELGVELISGPEIYKQKSEMKKASHINCTAMMCRTNLQGFFFRQCFECYDYYRFTKMFNFFQTFWKYCLFWCKIYLMTLSLFSHLLCYRDQTAGKIFSVFLHRK